MKINGRFCGTWHLGYAYSKGDIVRYENEYYKASSQIPCYSDDPANNPQWEKKTKRGDIK